MRSHKPLEHGPHRQRNLRLHHLRLQIRRAQVFGQVPYPFGRRQQYGPVDPVRCAGVAVEEGQVAGVEAASAFASHFWTILAPFLEISEPR